MPWTSRSPGFAASWRSGIARRHDGRVAARASVAYSLGLEATPRATRKVYNRQNGDRHDHWLSQPETHPLHVRGRRRGDWVHCAGQDHLQDWNTRRGLPAPHRDPQTSWVVNAGTGEPTGYTDPQSKHPDLHRDRVILKTGSELLALLKRCANP